MFSLKAKLKNLDSLARAGLGKLMRISSTKRHLELGAQISPNPIRQPVQMGTELTLGSVK